MAVINYSTPHLSTKIEFLPERRSNKSEVPDSPGH